MIRLFAACLVIYFGVISTAYSDQFKNMRLSPGIGKIIVIKDGMGKRIGTIEKGIGNRLIVYDTKRRRIAVIVKKR